MSGAGGGPQDLQASCVHVRVNVKLLASSLALPTSCSAWQRPRQNCQHQEHKQQAKHAQRIRTRLTSVGCVTAHGFRLAWAQAARHDAKTRAVQQPRTMVVVPAGGLKKGQMDARVLCSIASAFARVGALTFARVDALTSQLTQHDASTKMCLTNLECSQIVTRLRGSAKYVEFC